MTQPNDSTDVTQRLEYLRGELNAGRISWDELHELQDYGARGLIPEHDVQLLEAAGVPEFPDDVEPGDDGGGDDREPPEDHFRDDVEADADTLASAGFGTDEDYGGHNGGYDDE